MRPTKHDKQEWARLSDDAIAKGKDETAMKFVLAASLHDEGEIPIGIFDKLQEEYRSWLIDGFGPDMDSIKTREINVLVKENRELAANLKSHVDLVNGSAAKLVELRSALRATLDALHNETAGRADSPWIKSVKDAASTILTKQPYP